MKGIVAKKSNDGWVIQDLPSRKANQATKRAAAASQDLAANRRLAPPLMRFNEFDLVFASKAIRIILSFFGTTSLWEFVWLIAE